MEGVLPLSANELFVDRDPTLFPQVLQFLRDGIAPAALQKMDTPAGAALEKEFTFYGLPLPSQVPI